MLALIRCTYNYFRPEKSYLLFLVFVSNWRKLLYTGSWNGIKRKHGKILGRIIKLGRNQMWILDFSRIWEETAFYESWTWTDLRKDTTVIELSGNWGRILKGTIRVSNVELGRNLQGIWAYILEVPFRYMPSSLPVRCQCPSQVPFQIHLGLFPVH